MAWWFGARCKLSEQQPKVSDLGLEYFAFLLCFLKQPQAAATFVTEFLQQPALLPPAMLKPSTHLGELPAKRVGLGLDSRQLPRTSIELRQGRLEAFLQTFVADLSSTKLLRIGFGSVFVV